MGASHSAAQAPVVGVSSEKKKKVVWRWSLCSTWSKSSWWPRSRRSRSCSSSGAIFLTHANTKQKSTSKIHKSLHFPVTENNILRKPSLPGAATVSPSPKAQKEGTLWKNKIHLLARGFITFRVSKVSMASGRSPEITPAEPSRALPSALLLRGRFHQRPRAEEEEESQSSRVTELGFRRKRHCIACLQEASTRSSERS